MIMKKTNLLLLAAMLIGCLACALEDTLEDTSTYPSEEDFQRSDTLAFYLNDLLWMPFGFSKGFKWGWDENDLQARHWITDDSLRNIRLYAIMNYRKDGRTTFSQRFELWANDLSPEPAVILLDAVRYRGIQLADRSNDRFYASTAEAPVRLTITVFDDTQRRIEGFFEGQLFDMDGVSPPVEIRQGRFSMSY